jgi:mercuric ion transport protein
MASKDAASARANRALLTAGVIGTGTAVACCATPILAIFLGALGLGAWLSKADYVLIPLAAVSLGLIALGLYRLHVAARLCCDSSPPKWDS